MTISLTNIANAGPVISRAAVAIDDSAAVEITITVGKTYIELQNLGPNNCFRGDSGVTPDAGTPESSEGILFYVGDVLRFSNAKPSFSIWLKNESGETSNIGVNEA